MRLPLEQRLERLEDAVRTIAARFEVATFAERARIFMTESMPAAVAAHPALTESEIPRTRTMGAVIEGARAA